MEQFSSPKHIRENEFERLTVVCVCMWVDSVWCPPHWLSLSLTFSRSLFHNKGVCMWKISVGAFFQLLVISRIYFLIYIAIRKLIFQEKLWGGINRKRKKDESALFPSTAHGVSIGSFWVLKSQSQPRQSKRVSASENIFSQTLPFAFEK